MAILRTFGALFCSLKRVHADIFMLVCTLFNEQNVGSHEDRSVLGKQNVQANEVYWK